MTGPLDALRTGGKPALARALNHIEARAGDPAVTALLDAAYAAPRGHVLGLTGPPGVGKSTLINALIRALRAEGRTVAVIAIDPSSRNSGGALLGDRIRFITDPEDAGIFVRSMAARERLGGLAETTYPAMVLMRALYDLVIVETVGVGQSEIDVVGVADTVLLCAQPGSGDALQFMKAGIMEIPDLVVVTKADLGALARRTVADLKGAQSLVAGRKDRPPPAILTCAAISGDGVQELVAELLSRSDACDRTRRQTQATQWLTAHLQAQFGRDGVRRLRDAGLMTATLTNPASSESPPFGRAVALSMHLRTANSAVDL